MNVITYIETLPKTKRPMQNSKTPEERELARKAFDNILLDVILRREPHFSQSKWIIDCCITFVDGYIALRSSRNNAGAVSFDCA